MLLLRTARGAVPVVLRSYDARGDGLVHAVADIYGGTSAEGSGDREGPGCLAATRTDEKSIILRC